MSNSKSLSQLISESNIFHKEMPTGIQISVTRPNVLSEYMRYFLRERPLQFHPAYKEVADWLKDNEGKGLLLYGMCGQGKTLLARYVLPAILSIECHKVCHFYTMTEANQNPDEVMSHAIVSIDDVGVEEQSVKFGNRRNVFDEIMDDVEKKGKLIIITTNLTGKQIEEHYGERTMERIKACCKRVRFELRNNLNNPVSFRDK